MTNVQASQRSSEQGFTLVELAIVMVIIGLLIGGILKGQELIGSARVSATISQLKGVEAAMNTFQDKYAALPGDIAAPATTLPNCAAVPCSTPGNGNGVYTNVAGALPKAANEGVRAFIHLAVSDLISGVNAQGTTTAWGQMLPAARAGGGMWIGQSGVAGTATGGITTLAANRPYLAVNGTPAAVGATTGSMSSSVAAQIDRKMDDGVPASGTVQVVGTGCILGAVYDESNTASTCAMYSRAF